MKLVKLNITKAEYAALPHLSTLTERDLKEIVPLGFRCKDSQGVVREMVEGMQIFAHQWGAGSCVPDRGWRYYEPVFENGRMSDAPIETTD